MQETVVISIGGSVNGQQMEWGEWQRFISETTALATSYGDLVFRGEGTGFYEGRSEPSFTVIITPYPDDDDSDAEELMENCRSLAKRYNQDSIAVTWGETEFAGST